MYIQASVFSKMAAAFQTMEIDHKLAEKLTIWRANPLIVRKLSRTALCEGIIKYNYNHFPKTAVKI